MVFKRREENAMLFVLQLNSTNFRIYTMKAFLPLHLYYVFNFRANRRYIWAIGSSTYFIVSHLID